MCLQDFTTSQGKSFVTFMQELFSDPMDLIKEAILSLGQDFLKVQKISEKQEKSVADEWGKETKM